MDRIRLRQMLLFGLLGAMTFGAKYVMSALPNIEPVSLLVMVYASVLGRKSAYPIGIYVVLEFLFFGLGLWNINYLYIWAVPALGAWALRNTEEPLYWAILSGLFGLFFGALCAPVDAVIGGWGYAAARWVSGIPFDLLHCAGNFAMALVLFRPLRKLLQKQYTKLTRQ